MRYARFPVFVSLLVLAAAIGWPTRREVAPADRGMTPSTPPPSIAPVAAPVNSDAAAPRPNEPERTEPAEEPEDDVRDFALEIQERNALGMKQFYAATDDVERERILAEMPKFDDPTTIPFFAAIARDSVRYPAEVRARAVIGLNLRDRDDAVDVLWEVGQHDPDPSLRFLAIEGMGTNVGCRERVLPLLLSALNDDERLVRQGAVAGLQFLADPRAVGPIAAWIEREPDTTLAADAVILLGKYDGAEVTSRLRSLASGHADPQVRERAWQALLGRGDAAATQEFRRRAAAGEREALGRLAGNGAATGREALAEALVGEEARTVASDLGRKAADGDVEALGALEQAMSAENPPAARFRAAAAVARETGLPRGRAEACLRELASSASDAEARVAALTELFYTGATDGLALCESAAREGGVVGAHALALIEAYGLYAGRREEAEHALLRLLGRAPDAAAPLARVRDGKAEAGIEAWLSQDGVPPRRLIKAGDAVARALLHR